MSGCLHSIFCCECCCRNCQNSNFPTSGPIGVDSPNGSILIFVNPNSGAGKGLELFAEKLKPRILDSKLCYDLLITERPNHAKEIIKIRTDLFTFDAIIIVSGDGLLFEVLNGILEREDGESLLQKLAFGMFPTGSGNGLLASVFHKRNLPHSLPGFFDKAIDSIANLNSMAYAVNLTHIETDIGHFGSFLSVGWGLMADIDIESERYRRLLGSGRFFLGGLIRVFGWLRTYHGILSFLEAGPLEPSNDESFNVFNANRTITDDCPSYRSHKSTITEFTESTATCSEFLQDSTLWKRHQKPIGTIPDLNDPIPSNWTTIDDEFVLVYVMSLSHISPGNNYCPNAKLCDDRLHLTYILKKDVPSKSDLAKFLNAVENGKHLNFPFCKSVSVSSFRLEPKTDGSFIVVDGEVIKTSKIQATVSDLNMFVMSE